MTGDCATCPFPGSYLPYTPSLASNAFLLAAFAALVPISLFLGYRFPSLGFTLNFVTALCLQVLGFAGRLLLRSERGSRTFFALYLLGSVLGTTAFASALFVVLPHVFGVYEGRGVRGARVAVGFMGLLVVIVVLEIVGLAFAVFGLRGVVSTRVLVAGLSVQILALALFVVIHAWLALSPRDSQPDPQHADVYRAPKFKRFLLTLHVCVALILATTAYRIAEISPTLSTPAFANEAGTTTLHGALPLLLTLLLTACPPGHAFNRAWPTTTPRYVSQKAPPDNPYRAPERYAVRRVAPAPLCYSPATPYELYPGPTTTSPRKSEHTASPAYSPRKSEYMVSPAHSPRKIPERRLVDDDALW